MKLTLLLILITLLLASCALPFAKEEMDRADGTCVGQGGLSHIRIGTRQFEAHCNDGSVTILFREVARKTVADQ